MRFNKAQVNKKVQEAVQTATKDAIETATVTTRQHADAEHYGRARRFFNYGYFLGMLTGIILSVAIASVYYETIRDVLIKINNVLLEARHQQN